MKGVTLISGVIFLAITITAIVIVYEAGVPVVQKMQSAATIEKMKETFTQLDQIIQEVASEGKGSKRTVYLRIDPGTFVVNETDDTVYWKFNTKAFVISPRTFQRLANLFIGSNLETKTSEVTYHNMPAFLLENEHLKVYIKKFGASDNKTTYNTTQLLLGMYQKDLEQWFPMGSLEISLDNNMTSENGTGYTRIEVLGSNLPYGMVTAYMNSSYAIYHVNFTLESGTDFLIIEGGT